MPDGKTFDSAFERNDQLAGHSFSPAAISAACQQTSVTTTAVISPRIRYASPRCEPSKRRGRTTARMTTAVGDADEHEDDEEVDEQHVPALVPEPRQRRVHVDRGDHRHQDRREEDEEAPEDERVHQPRHDALQQRALAEHVDRFVADARRRVAAAVRRPRSADEPREEQRAPSEQRARHDEQRRESDRAGGDAYVPRAFLSSALMAGTISCRSPITA